MNIVILDGHAVNPGDMSWDAFKKLGSVTVYDRTESKDAISRIGGAEIVIVNKVQISAAIMDACPHMRYIGVLATGYNIIDITAASVRGITVTNIPSYSTAAVVQAVFALLFEFTNGVQAHSDSVHRGDWCRSPDFCYWTHPLFELSGKTMGIVGFGSIGSRVAAAALSFGMNVVAVTRSRDKIAQYNASCNTVAVRSVTFDELLKCSDIISLHCPLTEETSNLINSSTIRLMKKDVILINTARGPIVDECAVRAALDNNMIGGYGADVVSTEPMLFDNPLKGAPRCVLTPHVAWAAQETRTRLLSIAVENLRSFLADKPVNTVTK